MDFKERISRTIEKITNIFNLVWNNVEIRSLKNSYVVTFYFEINGEFIGYMYEFKTNKDIEDYEESLSRLILSKFGININN